MDAVCDDMLSKKTDLRRKQTFNRVSAHLRDIRKKIQATFEVNEIQPCWMVDLKGLDCWPQSEGDRARALTSALGGCPR